MAIMNKLNVFVEYARDCVTADYSLQSTDSTFDIMIIDYYQININNGLLWIKNNELKLNNTLIFIITNIEDITQNNTRYKIIFESDLNLKTFINIWKSLGFIDIKKEQYI